MIRTDVFVDDPSDATLHARQYRRGFGETQILATSGVGNYAIV
jgi:hypothetical protein